MESQGKNSIHNLPHIADFRLKCCMLKEDTKNNITGSNQQWTTTYSEIPRGRFQVKGIIDSPDD